jgi:hypothetical protein
MPPVPIRYDAAALDLGPRWFFTTTVAGSPAAAAITIVASLTITGDIASTKGVQLLGQAGWTVGTDGVSGLLQVRKTDAAGTVVGSTGAVTAVAATLRSDSVIGIDTAPTLPGQVYVLTLTVASGSAPSTVGFVRLVALVV